VSLTPPRQLSLFGVEAAEPGPADLAGLLAGPGQVERMGGTARVSVLVDAAWRVHVLVAELALRGLTASWEEVESKLVVRTAFTTALAPLAAAWLASAPAANTAPLLPGARASSPKLPPPGFFLTGPRLRLWVAAAGSPDPPGYLLRLGPSDEAIWGAVGGALAAAGLPAVLVAPAGTATAAPGPAYRIIGRRRLARLAELVGERPHAAPAGAWPG
jgi:hypothetical protein